MKNLPRIEFLATGNELLDGSIVDTNSQRLAHLLSPFGLSIDRITIVPDRADALTHEFKRLLRSADIVVVSGGLGPTTDDLTLEIAAKAFGKKMIQNKDALKNVTDFLAARGMHRVNASNMKQALIPQTAKVLRNDVGTAPGVGLKIKGTQFYFLPGVPTEFQHLIERYLVPVFDKMKAKKGRHLFIHKVFGVPESELNELLKTIELSPDVELGFRTHFPENHIKFLVEASNRKEAEKKISKTVEILQGKLGRLLFSSDHKTFAEAILEDLKKENTKVAIAESCTGGLVSSMLTQIPGSSQVLDRAFVTYSNEAKAELLGVSSDSLKKHGAVSEEVAREMALGALQKSPLAKVSLAITGIAGPDGGTKEKPVGTIWICVADRKGGIKTKLLHLSRTRKPNQVYSAYLGLQMLRDLLT